MNITFYIVLFLMSYILGAIPVGYLLVKKVTGKNILELGSGNTGSTNVGRIAGRKWSIITQLLDMGKGLLPVGLFFLFTQHQKMKPDYLVHMLAIAAIMGHNFSIFLQFKGGKGVNTTLGASVLLAPFAVFAAVIVYFVIKWRYRYVSLGSIVLAVTLPFVELILSGQTPTFYYLLLCSVLIVFTHKENIRRLLNNNELSAKQ